MKIDHSRLEAVIKDLLEETLREPHLVANGVAIGKINGLQIQVTVSKDRDDHMPNRKAFRCITPE